MVILTLNCGSSSAKYQVYDWDNKEVMANGVVERIGIEGSCITHKAKGQKIELESPCPTHKEAIELIMKEITDKEVLDRMTDEEIARRAAEANKPEKIDLSEEFSANNEPKSEMIEIQDSPVIEKKVDF